MEVFFLGTGTGIPLHDRSSPSVAVFYGEPPILLDLGPGALRQMKRAGLDHTGIEWIFVTHFHPDHTADLVHFLFATRNPFTLRHRKPFTIMGPPGLKLFLDDLSRAYGDALSLPPGLLTVQELDPASRIPYTCQGLRIRVAPTRHIAASLAYRLEDPAGKSVVYSGDTGFCDEVVQLARGANLLILEASFPDSQEVEGHLTPSQAGHMASLATVERLVLTHFYPECLATDIAAQCRRTYGGPLTLATDFLRIRV